MSRRPEAPAELRAALTSIVPVVFEVHCVAGDCEPDRWQPVTRPIRLEGTRREVERELRRRGWRPAFTRGAWFCPTHAPLGS